MIKNRLYLLILLLLVFGHYEFVYSQTSRYSGSPVKLARVKYSGGGDWYNDPSSEVNLLRYVAKHTNILVDITYEYVDLESDNLFLYPLLFITGHGNINLSDIEAQRLRVYLENGGFLYIDDDYGLNEYVQREIKKVFPNKEFVELPFNHEIYNCHFKFNDGLPKIHEHDNKPPQGLAILHEGRVCVFYTFESNLGDGWADPEIHKNPEEIRELALKMGTNILVYALTR